MVSRELIVWLFSWFFYVLWWSILRQRVLPICPVRRSKSFPNESETTDHAAELEDFLSSRSGIPQCIDRKIFMIFIDFLLIFINSIYEELANIFDFPYDFHIFISMEVELRTIFHFKKFFCSRILSKNIRQIKSSFATEISHFIIKIRDNFF